jgi:hypothetical protein
VIETRDERAPGTIDLGGGPEFAFADGYAFNNLEVGLILDREAGP